MFEELQDIAETLANRLGRSVTIEDPSIRLLVHTAHESGAFDRLRVESIMQKQCGSEVVEWIRTKGIAQAVEPVRLPANTDLGMMPRICVPIRCQGYLFGYLWLLDSDSSTTDEELAAAIQAAASAGEVLFRAQLLGDLKRRHERQLLRDLLADDTAVREHAARQFVADERFAADSSAVVMVLHVEEPGERPDTVIDLALQHMVRQLAPMRAVSTAGRGDGAILLVADRRPPELKRMRAAAHEIVRELTGALGDRAEVTVGIGTVVASIADAQQSHMCAEDAVRVAMAVPGHGSVVSWDELGVYRVLVQLPLGQLRDSAIPGGLLRLFDLDRARVLIETLEVYLDEAGSVSKSIERLSVHRTSLYYRLGRIEEITGMRLGDGKDRLALHLGMKLARLVGIGAAAG